MGCCSSKQQFAGQGQRLGSAGDAPTNKLTTTAAKYEDYPKPKYNKNLTDEERENIRRERAAAAEARAKQNQIGKPQKKKKTNANAPLVGPNSKNAMSWQLG